MGPEGWLSLFTLASIFGMLIFSRAPADFVFSAGLAFVYLSGVVTIEEALSGFANPGVYTIGILYVLAAGVRETGGLSWLGAHILGSPKSKIMALVRMTLPVSFTSAFLNNTPVVAMFIPALRQWSRKIAINPSQLMIPLSYAAIVGGFCTMIGTSTNLVVGGMLQERFGGEALSIFAIAPVGVPLALIALFYLIFIAGRLLPDQRGVRKSFENTREYMVEMIIIPGSDLTGKSAGQSGMQNLPGGNLAEVIRDEMITSPVPDDFVFQEKDRLVFTGMVDSILELRRNHGLRAALDHRFFLDNDLLKKRGRHLVEAVVSNTCPLVGKNPIEGEFTKRYNAVIIAAARNGKRIKENISTTILHAGDTLLLETHAGFVPRQKDSRDFYLVSPVEDSEAMRFEKAPIAFSILALMVFLAATSILPLLSAALIAIALLFITRCISISQARKSVEWNVLVTIASALGIAFALEKSGAASAIAEGVFSLTGSDPFWLLVALYLSTAILTELITNNAAAALLFPVAMGAAESLGVNPMPFAIAIMIAASASFITPIGYQTNLMVYGPGGYRFGDYVKAGLPLTFLIGISALILIPVIWPF